MSVQVSYKKQTVLTIFLILTLISVIEISARIYQEVNPPCFFTKADAYPEFEFSYLKQMCNDISNVVWGVYPELHQIPDQHFKTININSDGFRGEEIKKEKNVNSYRIFVIGGSTAWFGSSDNTTISGFLQQQFSEKNPELQIEVINAAISNAFSYTETKLIKEKIIHYKPDLIIVFDGWNDLGRSYGKFNTALDGNIVTDFLADKIRKSFPYWKTPFVAKFLVQVDLPNLFFNDRIERFDDNYIDEKVGIWSDRWSEICELGEINGFDTIVTIQPILGASENKKLTKYEKINYERLENNKIKSSYQKFADALENLPCSKVVDLRDVYDNFENTIYFDYGHTGDFGNRIIAEKFHESSLPIIKQAIK